MRKFKFEADYYEWHLTDAETGETLHNLVDPSEDLFNEDDMPMSREEIEDFCFSELECADRWYSQNEDYNGIMLKERLDKDEMSEAAKLMADVLYNYYIK